MLFIIYLTLNTRGFFLWWYRKSIDKVEIELEEEVKVEEE